tara:strand:+ start:100 stop:420 length:321 start_codon:yes stop_codon:yes gene_type:complete
MARKTGNRQEARQRAEQQGRTAELVALVYLMLTCHRILARRWRGSAGEIDLIARRGRRIIFVEVKFRHRSDAGAYRQYSNASVSRAPRSNSAGNAGFHLPLNCVSI